MGLIHILSDKVANQIAAGEVVERPAAIVKELVENSLDAGATWIEVEFTDGGTSFIRVEDNGSGMAEKDALLCLQRHATSKLHQLSDLDTIQSFGFRGEAIPSIASVSTFRLKTQIQGSNLGTEVLCKNSQIIEQKNCSMAAGTRMEVTNLFHCVPARLKFLKSHTTEANHIIHIVKMMAIAHPHVAFTLIQNSKIVFESPSCPNVTERIQELLGEKYISDMVELPPSRDAVPQNATIKVSGFILKPNTSGFVSRQDTFLFVNKRPIESRLLLQALSESYHSYIPVGRYPKGILFIEIDSRYVDVNTHPTKKEVRFKDDFLVKSHIVEHISLFLMEYSKLKVHVLKTDEFDYIQSGSNAIIEIQQRNKNVSSIGGHSFLSANLVPAKETHGLYTIASKKNAENIRQLSTIPSYPQSSRFTNTHASTLPWKFICLLPKNYVFFKTEKELIILNCPLANQRVQYEKFLEQLEQSTPFTQSLLIPLILSLNSFQLDTAIYHTKFLNALGFQIEEFGRTDCRLIASPAWLEPSQTEVFFIDIVTSLMEEGLKSSSKPDVLLQRFIRLSSPKFLGPSSILNEPQVLSLAQDLLSCRQPLTSPTGQPTLHSINFSDLDKKFL